LHRPPVDENNPDGISEYEHSSIPKTLRSIFGLKSIALTDTGKALTPREEFAGNFNHIFESEPRPDTIEQLPDVYYGNKDHPFYYGKADSSDEEKRYRSEFACGTGYPNNFVCPAAGNEADYGLKPEMSCARWHHLECFDQDLQSLLIAQGMYS
jgi:hypothetical protein